MMQKRTAKNFIKSITGGNNKFVLAGLIIIAMVAYLIIGPLDLLSISGSYSNAYEGAKPSFAGVTYNGQNYASSQTGKQPVLGQGGQAYYQNNGMSFSFKGDGPANMYLGLPKIVGEMTPVFIPQATAPGDLPSQFDIGGVKVVNPFTSSFNLINNPYHTYSWSINHGTSTTLYKMEEWKTKYYVSISANPDGGAVPFANSEWDEANGRYSDVTVWIKLDTAPTWYFQGQERAYFAIAQVQLAGISYAGHNPDGTVQSTHNQQKIQVNPSSPSSAVMLYTRNFGAGGNEAADPEQIYSYKGQTLNPQYFGNSIYFPITLNNFGSQSWGTPGWDWASQGDVVSFDFTVTQFVVGQWTVQNTQPTPNGYGRQSSYDRTGIGVGFDQWLMAVGNDPFWRLVILGVILVILLGIAIWKFPEFINLANKGAKSASSRINTKRKKS